MNKVLVVISDLNKHSCADAAVESWFQQNKDNDVIELATSIQFNRVHLAHMRGEIVVDQICLEDLIGTINEKGGIDWDGETDGYNYALSIIIELCKLCG
jgi:hypothetical protein